MIERHLYVFGGYERALQAEMRRFLKRGDVFVDVGANMGVHTCCMARHVGPKGQGIAVEPIPDLAGRLERNLELNGLENVTILRSAAGERAGTVQIYPPRRGVSNQMLASHTWRPELEDEPLEVPVDALTTLVRAVTDRRVALIKIDVEGAELDVLQGATDLLRADRPAVLFEQRTMPRGQEVVEARSLLTISDLLESAGYVIVDSVGVTDRMHLAIPASEHNQ